MPVPAFHDSWQSLASGIHARALLGRFLNVLNADKIDNVVTEQHLTCAAKFTILNMKRKNGECLWLEVREQSIRPV